MKSGPEKVATFLLTLERPAAADLLKRLPEVDRQAVTAALTGLGDAFLASQERDEIYNEFQDTLTSAPGEIRAPDEIKGLLDEALGSEARAFAQQMETVDLCARSTAVLKKLDEQALAFLFEGEHPQAIAVVLLELGSDKASAVLPLFPKEMQQELIERMVTMEKLSSEVVAGVLQAAADKARLLEASGEGGSSEMERLKMVATMLNRFDEAAQRDLLSGVEANDPDRAQAVKDQLFTFEDLIKLGVRDVQRILSGIDTRVLATSLKGASQEITDFLLSNISKRVCERVEEERETLGALRLSEVRQAQNEMAAVARDLIQRGEIVFGGGEDELVE